MSELADVFSPAVVAAIERLVDERVAAALTGGRSGATAKRWLTVREAGDYLGCGDRAVYARIRRGRIPSGAVKHSGRSVLVDRQALDLELERSA